MSLRFERKTTNKLRSTFSCRSRSERDGYLMVGSGGGQNNSDEKASWSFRQARFATDYLNLMDQPQSEVSLVRNPTSMPPILREKSGGLRSFPVPGPKVPERSPDVLKISEGQQLYSEGVKRGPVQEPNNSRRLPPILSSGSNIKSPKERCVSFNFNSSSQPINRRDSLASVASSNASSPSYAASTVSSSSLGSSNLYEDLIEMGLGEYGQAFKELVSVELISCWHPDME